MDIRISAEGCREARLLWDTLKYNSVNESHETTFYEVWFDERALLVIRLS